MINTSQNHLQNDCRITENTTWQIDMLNINNKREATLFWGFACREFNTYYPLPNDYKETKKQRK